MNTRIALLGIALTVGALRTADGQASVTLESYRAARAALDRAFVAHRVTALTAAADLTVSYEGVRHMRYQSYRAEPPWDTQNTSWTTVLDLRNSRIRRDFVERYPKDFEFVGRQVFTSTGGFRYDPTRRFEGDALQRFTTLNFDRARGGMDFDVPAFLVQRATRRAATLRLLDTLPENDRSYIRILFADQDGSQVTLFFDRDTGLLARYETLRSDGVEGDVVASVAFDDYRNIGAIPLATRRIERHNGHTVREGRLHYVLNSTPHDSLFVEPTGYVAPAPRGAEAEPLRKLADGVWLIQNLGNRIMFVEFADHVVVFETPLPQTTANTVMEIVRRTVPGKPIRYVTFSHHHDDHAGGLRPYVAEGISIVTTNASRRFVERVASATHTIAPDTLSRAPRLPRIETFVGKRVFADGTMSVELHELGANSHVDGMAFAWLPGPRIIFQGDALILPEQGEVPAANTLTVEFLSKIEALRLPVDFIAGVHGRVGTLADLRTAVARRRQMGDR